MNSTIGTIVVTVPARYSKNQVARAASKGPVLGDVSLDGVLRVGVLLHQALLGGEVHDGVL